MKKHGQQAPPSYGLECRVGIDALVARLDGHRMALPCARGNSQRQYLLDVGGRQRDTAFPDILGLLEDADVKGSMDMERGASQAPPAHGWKRPCHGWVGLT